MKVVGVISLSVYLFVAIALPQIVSSEWSGAAFSWQTCNDVPELEGVVLYNDSTDDVAFCNSGETIYDVREYKIPQPLYTRLSDLNTNFDALYSPYGNGSTPSGGVGVLTAEYSMYCTDLASLESSFSGQDQVSGFFSLFLRPWCEFTSSAIESST